MTRGRKLIILLGVLAVMAAAYVIIVKTGVFSQEAAEEEIVLSGGEAAPTRMAWSYGGESTALVKNSQGAWECQDQPDFPLSSLYSSRMESAVSPVTATRRLEKPGDLLEYGLSEPWLTVTVEYEGGQAATYQVGDQNALTGEYYVLPLDGEWVYTVSDVMPGAFTCALMDIVEYETVDSISDVRAYSLTSPDGALTQPQELSETLTNAIVGFSWSDCVSWQAQREDLSAWGLDKPSVCVVTYVTTEYQDSGETDGEGQAVAEAVETEHSFTLHIGSYTQDGAYAYARLPGSSMVYAIAASTADALLLK